MSFDVFIAALFLFFCIFFEKSLSSLSSEVHSLIDVKESLYTKNFSFRDIFCKQNFEQSKKLCYTKVSLKQKGVWKDFCLFSEKEISYKRKRYYLFKLKCRGWAKVFDQKHLAFF